VQQCCRAVEQEHAGEGSQRVQGLAGKRDATHESQQADSARGPSSETDRHLQHKLDCDAAEGGSAQTASGQ
jgi:hypothetical protein